MSDGQTARLQELARAGAWGNESLPREGESERSRSMESRLVSCGVWGEMACGCEAGL